MARISVYSKDHGDPIYDAHFEQLFYEPERAEPLNAVADGEYPEIYDVSLLSDTSGKIRIFAYNQGSIEIEIDDSRHYTVHI